MFSNFVLTCKLDSGVNHNPGIFTFHFVVFLRCGSERDVVVSVEMCEQSAPCVIIMRSTSPIIPCYSCVTVLLLCYCVTLVLLCYFCVTVLLLCCCVAVLLLCYHYALNLTHHHPAQRGDNCTFRNCNCSLH